LLDWVFYPSSSELCTEVVGSNDIARDAGEYPGGDSDEKSFSRDRSLEDFFGGEGASFFFFPAESVDDLFIDGEDDGVGEVAVCVCLGDNEARFLVVALVDEPTGGFGAEGSVLRRIGGRREGGLT
jgi:hypothetical protein